MKINLRPTQSLVLVFLFCFALLGCSEGFKSSTANKSSSSSSTKNGVQNCSVDGLTYAPGATITGYIMSSVVYPALCTPATRTCLETGQFDGIIPTYTSCTQQCRHPDTNQASSAGTIYYSFTKSSGATQAECDGYKVASTCNPATGTFLPAPPTVKFNTCSVVGQTCAYTTGTGINNPTGNMTGATATGYTASAATYPTLCGASSTVTCQSNGTWTGSTPRYTSCTQKCLHPDSSMPVDQGTTYTYYTQASGTQTQCNAAKVTSSCSAGTGLFAPAVATTRYATCSVTVPTTTTTSSSSTTTTLMNTTTTTLNMATPTYFPQGAEWTRDVSNAALDPESSTVINWLSNNGGWGTGSMQVDFSIHVLPLVAGTPFAPTQYKPGAYTGDCDAMSTFPLPVGGAVEGYNNYTCTDDSDCHLLVHDAANRKLYESYNATVTNGTLQSLCMIVWDLNRVYPASGRGEQCTSSDAAGFPVAPLLFTADEIAKGSIDHAIRFILPNPRMRTRTYVRPASHAGAPSGPAQAPPYGARFRLKSNFDMNRLPNNAARIVARAMQKYGMLLSDGGNIALTAQSDRNTTAKWSDVGFGPRDLAAIQVTDFEMIDAGPRITLTYDCVRNP